MPEKLDIATGAEVCTESKLAIVEEVDVTNVEVDIEFVLVVGATDVC